MKTKKNFKKLGNAVVGITLGWASAAATSMTLFPFTKGKKWAEVAVCVAASAAGITTQYFVDGALNKVDDMVEVKEAIKSLLDDTISSEEECI